MNYYFNFDKISMFHHMVNNHNYYDNNHLRIIMSRFTIFDCNMDMNHLENSSNMNYYFNFGKISMFHHMANNHNYFDNNH